ncbi:MAG TPA: K(+)-transporting ATPase subunit C [Burkholderiales bacterium]|jgi:K+-transporting ATPase ATPase C chain|nr:K(+)-transporting ATPase subunit C [Burkholderiales bacterium]
MNKTGVTDRRCEPLLRDLLRPALTSAVFFMILTGLAYPLLTTGVAQLLFPHQANGSLLERDGHVIGSALLGQNFIRQQYFHPRPSATVTSDPADPDKTIALPYNAALSGASNLGPSSRKLITQVAERARAYRRENGLSANAPVPVDAVTASGSGIDPDISLANARLQAGRIARARKLPEKQVLMLITQQVTPRQFDVLGDPRVNVLKLNLALDANMNAIRRPAAQ